MHKGVILLVKATDKDEAIEKTNTFMERYGDGKVWDWFSIGNRWHNTLAPTAKVEKFKKKALKSYPQLKGIYSIASVENAIDRPIIQKMWEDEGLSGKNPYWSGYGFDVKDSEKDYNVIPLSECLDIVQSWKKDLAKKKETIWKKMTKARKEAKAGKYDLSASYANDYADIVYGNFCFESNVYNVEEELAEDIPEDITGYYAVMVDIHN